VPPHSYVPAIPTPGSQGRGFLSKDVLPETGDILLLLYPRCNPVRWDRSSFTELVAPESKYFTEVVGRFRQLYEGMKLVANVSGLLHLR